MESGFSVVVKLADWMIDPVEISVFIILVVLWLGQIVAIVVSVFRINEVSHGLNAWNVNCVSVWNASIFWMIHIIRVFWQFNRYYSWTIFSVIRQDYSHLVSNSWIAGAPRNAISFEVLRPSERPRRSDINQVNRARVHGFFLDLIMLVNFVEYSMPHP